MKDYIFFQCLRKGIPEAEGRIGAAVAHTWLHCVNLFAWLIRLVGGGGGTTANILLHTGLSTSVGSRGSRLRLVHPLTSIQHFLRCPLCLLLSGVPCKMFFFDRLLWRVICLKPGVISSSLLLARAPWEPQGWQPDCRHIHLSCVQCMRCTVLWNNKHSAYKIQSFIERSFQPMGTI